MLLGNGSGVLGTGRTEEVPDEPDDDATVRRFDVHAIDVDIVYNRYGLHQPVGVMYALEENLDEIRRVSGKRPCDNNVVFDGEDKGVFCEGIPDDERAYGDTRAIQPLTLRVNRGDLVEIEFHNDLDRPASIHQTGLPFEVEGSDGNHVGENPDTTVDPGESITYRWYADRFGGHFFHDGANQAYDSADEPPQVSNLVSRGLFGGVVVHPKGTRYSDPYTGKFDDEHVSRDDLALVKYGKPFEDLSVQTSGQVQALYNRQPYSDHVAPGDLLTREQLAAELYDVDLEEHELADELSAERIVELQDAYDRQFGDLPTDPEYGLDDISRAKYDRRFARLSVQTAGQVRALYNRQPFADGAEPTDLRTREEVAQHLFERDYFDLSRESRVSVVEVYESQFRVGGHSNTLRVQGRVQADVHLPDQVSQEAVAVGMPAGLSYREFLVYYHTPEGIETADGGQLTYPFDDTPQSVHAINYRADPTGSRIPALRDAGEDPEPGESFYSSWLHGDPGGGDNVYPMYVGDPVMAIPVGASIEENHVHHLHGHRWKETPPTDSDTIDSQSIGQGAVYQSPYTVAFGSPSAEINDFSTIRPDMTFDEAFDVGAGGAHGTTGDVLFHCHLFPHYGEGMWGVMRALDKERRGLNPLPNNDPPIPKDSDVPGFPEFIPGEFEQVAPFPPYGDLGEQYQEFRDPSDGERAALGEDIVPGAPYTDPCESDLDGFEPEFEGELREYTIVALPADIVYNDAGHHDPNGLVYVLEEDAEKVKNGEMNPEPLVIRANVGDCVEITFRNEVTEENLAALPDSRFPPGGEEIGADSVPIEAAGKSTHIHFVSYDLLGSDSLATGFNYRQDTQPGEQMPYRWYADEEGTIFFHDHISGIDDEMHGSFAALVVEPPESEWLDPYSGEPIERGTQAIIDPEEGEAYREFCVAYQDFAQLIDRDGELVNQQLEHNENAGVMALNYRNAPYYLRDDADPAYVHSSFVHGDPSTPVFEAYEDDPVRFRLWQATYEEQHNFTMHGRRFTPVGSNPEEAATQIIGTSEAFTIDLLPDEKFEERHDGFEPLDENPAGLPIRDYVYGSKVVDDLWDGMWGLYRELGGRVKHLEPLPDRKPPKRKISRKELKKMGHPAPYSDFEWSEYGQVARLLYGEDDDRHFPPDRDDRQNDCIDGNPPDIAPCPGTRVPKGTTVEQFDVSAFDQPIRYNDYGDYDPFGIVYALEKNVEHIRNCDVPLTPLNLRVNQGEAVEVTLTNDVDFDAIDEDHPHPLMQGPDQEWERSERISLHPQRLRTNVLGSDGATAGFNWDQTVGPGESITYRWFVNGDSASSVLHDHADVRSNRHHGAYGVLVVGEKDAEYLDPKTGERAPQGYGDATIVKRPDGPDRREFALTHVDGQYIVNEDDPGSCVVPPGDDPEAGEFDPDTPCNQLGDPEDHGYPAVNYRSEPFIRRFEASGNVDESLVFDSDTHGDPATPLPRALLGDPTTFRVQKAADKADGLAWHLSAHQWERRVGVEQSKIVGVDDEISTTKSDRMDVLDGAGGAVGSVGDHLYQETRQRRKLEGGEWGIFRVRKKFRDFEEPIQPLPDRCDGLAPEHRPGWNVARKDVTGDGHEDLLVGVPHSSVGAPGAGAAYVLFGPVDHPVTDLLDADVQFLGTAPDAGVGTHVAIESGGDGDGYEFVVESEAGDCYRVEASTDHDSVVHLE